MNRPLGRKPCVDQSVSIPQNESKIDFLRSEGLSKDAIRTYLQGFVSDFVSKIQLMETSKGVQNIVSVEDYKMVKLSIVLRWQAVNSPYLSLLMCLDVGN